MKWDGCDGVGDDGEREREGERDGGTGGAIGGRGGVSVAKGAKGGGVRRGIWCAGQGLVDRRMRLAEKDGRRGEDEGGFVDSNMFAPVDDGKDGELQDGL